MMKIMMHSKRPKRGTAFEILKVVVSAVVYFPLSATHLPLSDIFFLCGLSEKELYNGKVMTDQLVVPSSP